MQKEVFILGAGFSYPANLPLQKDLIKEIYKNKDFLLLKEQAFFEKFLDNFLVKDKTKIDIEDIFTIFDRAYKNEEFFYGFSWNELHKIRQSLIKLIISLLDKRLQKVEKYKSQYENFIKYLCTNHKKVSIIVLNWDTLLEKLIKNICDEVMIDYCFYTYSLEDNSHIPHINLKSKNYKNLKTIKIHGSINWLLCQNCQRMYVDDEKILSIGKDTHKICQNCKKFNNLDINLDNFIITPTIIKNFENLHLKYIWNNALIEIQEAKNITFIGYSFPKADYEFLYTIKKAFSKDKKVSVVDISNNVKNRYETIFSDVDFNFNGFEEWSKQLIL